MSDRLSAIFSYTGKKVGINSLRSSYVPFENSDAIRNGKQLTVNQKEKIAERMRSSRKYLDEAYLKIFPILQEYLGRQEPASEPVVRPVDETSPTKRQNRQTKQYYYDNKEKVLAQQKEYQDKTSLFEKAKSR